MKKVILSTILVFACMGANAFAVDANSSWQDIAAAGLDASFPAIGFPPAVGEAISGVCLEADGVTLNGGNTDICVNSKRGHCVETASVALRTSIDQTEQVCTRSVPRAGCVEYKTVSYQIPLNYDISVYQKSFLGNGDVKWDLQFTKSFTIPACTN